MQLRALTSFALCLPLLWLRAGLDVLCLQLQPEPVLPLMRFQRGRYKTCFGVLMYREGSGKEIGTYFVSDFRSKRLARIGGRQLMRRDKWAVRYETHRVIYDSDTRTFERLRVD